MDRVMTAVGLLLLAALLGPAAVDDSEFTKYAGEAPLVGSPAAPQMTPSKARRFRTVLRNAASEGPNFNGHYRVAHWGCGTNCIEWAVIVLTDGRVWFAPEETGSCPAPDEPPELDWPDWIEVRATSRLMYLHDCSGEGLQDRTFDRRLVYEWNGCRPRLLRTEAFRAPGGTARK